MTYKEMVYYQSIARKERYTNDRKFNKGKDDILQGNIHTDEAKYFLQCLCIR